MADQPDAASPFRRRPDLATLNGYLAGTLPATLGIEVTELGEDFLRGRMPVDARTTQTFGLLHGGASAALAETLGSIAGNLCLADGHAVGLEINANHLRSATAGFVVGTARPLHLGRRTQVWDIRIDSEAGQPVCVARLTLAVSPASP
jgi:1,4-dihydroxy-2-naphthoyl-CoA hydrolase